MEITLKPTESLEIQEFFEIPLDIMVSNQALSNGNLMWVADGLVICFGGYGHTDQLIHQQTEGHYRWVHLEYSFEMKTYTPTIKAEKLNQQVVIYDMSHHPFYQKVGEFIINYKKNQNKQNQ